MSAPVAPVTSVGSDGLWRDRAFTRWLTAKVLSTCGSVITLIALPIMAYRISGSASVTALVAACEAAPYLLFGLVAGALTDRWDRKRVMVTADVLSAALIASLPLAHLLAQVTVPHVLLVAFCGPAIGVFLDGAVFGAIPMLVGRGRIAHANSVVWGLASVCEIALPALVGVTLAAVHPSTLMAADALTFAASAALIVSITRPMTDPDRVRPPLTVRQLGRDIAEGLRYLVRHPGVRSMTVIGSLQCVAGGGVVAVMVVWIDQRLGAGTSGLRFGVVYGAWAAGSLLASLLVPRLVRVRSLPQVVLGALPVNAALALLVPLVTTWWQGAAVLAGWSVAYSAIVLSSVSYRQQVTPEAMLGRVNTAGRMLSWGLGWTGGAALSAALVGPLGLVATLACFACVPIVTTVFAWTSPLCGAQE